MLISVCSWCENRPRSSLWRWVRIMGIPRWWPLLPIRVTHGQCASCRRRWLAEYRLRRSDVNYPKYGAGTR